MLLRFALVLSLSLAAPFAARADDDQDAEKFQGAWLATTAELGGKPLPDEFCKTIKLMIEGNSYTVPAGSTVDKGTLKLNPTPKPKQLDIVGVDGPNKGKTILAIYELDGDTLRVCYDLSGSSRPNDFKTKEGTALLLISYEREEL